MSDKDRDVKMVVIIRGDLKNTKGEKVRSGKIAAQCCHSALGFVWDNLKGRKISFELSIIGVAVNNIIIDFFVILFIIYFREL